MHNNMNVNVSGPVQAPAMQSYQTIVLKYNIVDGHNLLTQAMVSHANTKYVIKWDYVLGEDITIPENCIFEFDGGSISNGTITGQNTLVNIIGNYDPFNDVTRNGTWESQNPADVPYVENVGMGRVYLRINIVEGVNSLTQDMINEANTIYIIRYDYTLKEDITIPANCIIQFDGGSLNGTHYIAFNGCKIEGTPKIYCALRQVAGVKYFSWFDDGNGDSAVLERILNTNLPEGEGRTEGIKLIIDKPLRITETIKVYKNVHISGVSKEQLSWIYPYSNFVGDYVIDIEGDGLVGDYAFRNTIENLYIHTLAYTPAQGEALKAIIHIHSAYGIELNQLRVANSATNNTATGLDISNILGVNINCFVYYGNANSNAVGIKFGNDLRLVTCNYLSSENVGTALLLEGNGISSIRGFYTERQSTSIDCKLTSGGVCSIVGGFIPLAGPYTMGIDVTTAENAYLTVEGVGFKVTNTSKKGVYLRGNYQKNVTLIGIPNDLISAVTFVPLATNTNDDLHNIISYSGSREVQHLKKYNIGKISSINAFGGKGCIVNILVKYFLSETAYSLVKKSFSCSFQAGVGYKFIPIADRIIDYKLGYNQNTRFNLYLSAVNAQFDNGAYIVLEASVTGATQQGKANISYNIEIIPDIINSTGFLPMDNSEGTTLESITLETPLLKGGTTAQRPSDVPLGYNYYDTSLSKPIWHNGTNWVDATGATV